MSGNAATIRTTLGTQGQWNAQAHAALDALLAEKQRLQELSLLQAQEIDAFDVENQRLRDALDDAPSQWVDDADLFVKYTAWLESIGGERR